MISSTVWIGLGSNLAKPIQQVTDALKELESIPNSTLVSSSSLYESEPFGPVEQDNFINAVACLETTLDAHELLDHLQSIEQQHERKREVHWGPRTLDLDILLFGTASITTERLNVPHPYLNERNFVLYPLLEIDADLRLPSGTPLSSLTDQCPLGNLHKISL